MSDTSSSLTPSPSLAVNQDPSDVITTREVIDVSSIPATVVPSVASLNLKEVKFDDVVITEETSYPVAKKNKHVTTSIKSIFLIPIVGYTTIQLRSVAKFLGIECARTSKKPEVCQQIIEWVSDESNAVVTVAEAECESVSCVINRKRYFNVILRYDHKCLPF